MGGSSSGWHRGGKRTTDDMRSIDVRKLARDGLLNPGAVYTWSWTRRGAVVASIQIWPVERDRVRLMYCTRTDRAKDEWRSMDYSVNLIYTPCAFGGERVWWQCPTVGCGRRVALLFGGGVYACRHCQKLAYESQRVTDGDAYFRRADNIRARLGWHPGVAFPVGDRPKGMHQQTYNRWLLRYYDAANRALGASSEGLDKMMKRLGRIDM